MTVAAIRREVRARLALGGRIGQLLRFPAAALSTFVLLALTLGAILAPVVRPYDPTAMGVGPPLDPPGPAHLFGTDRYGRDVFSRILYGSRISLPIGVFAVTVSSVIGSVWGLATGFLGGAVDTAGTGLIDIMLGFPPIMLALLIIAVLGVGIQNVVIAVGVGGIPRFARIVRGTTIGIRENVYIESGRAIGTSKGRMLFRHLLPNVLPPIIVLATLYIGSAILEASALGFLGLGVQPPTPEWGTMLSEGREFMRHAPWLMVFPGGMVFVTVVAINLVGDYLRIVLDPRLRGR